MPSASADGRWLWIGPWDQELSQRECGFEIVEQLSFAEMGSPAAGVYQHTSK